MSWKIKYFMKKIPKLKKPILIEGLPGIGNVGKIAADYIAEQNNAKRYCTFFSPSLPPSVFITEDRLVSLPSIELVLIRKRSFKHDVLLLLGDVQPMDEISAYSLTDEVLSLSKSLGVKEIVTLGGIGLPAIPKKPKVYITGNDSSLIKKYVKKYKVNDDLYGVVGPIIGMTGLLVAKASDFEIPSVALLGETTANPLALGMAASLEILSLLQSRFSIPFDKKKLNKEIKEIESEIMKRAEEFHKFSYPALKKNKLSSSEELDYIG